MVFQGSVTTKHESPTEFAKTSIQERCPVEFTKGCPINFSGESPKELCKRMLKESLPRDRQQNWPQDYPSKIMSEGISHEGAHHSNKNMAFAFWVASWTSIKPELVLADNYQLRANLVGEYQFNGTHDLLVGYLALQILCIFWINKSGCWNTYKFRQSLAEAQLMMLEAWNIILFLVTPFKFTFDGLKFLDVLDPWKPLFVNLDIPNYFKQSMKSIIIFGEYQFWKSWR